MLLIVLASQTMYHHHHSDNNGLSNSCNSTSINMNASNHQHQHQQQHQHHHRRRSPAYNNSSSLSASGTSYWRNLNSSGSKRRINAGHGHVNSYVNNSTTSTYFWKARFLFFRLWVLMFEQNWFCWHFVFNGEWIQSISSCEKLSINAFEHEIIWIPIDYSWREHYFSIYTNSM